MDILNDIELDDEVKSQLTERISQYVESTINESTSGLKNKVDELLNEKKKEQKIRREAEQLAKQEAEEKAKAENDYKQLFESQKSEAEQLRQQIDEMNSMAKKSRISGEAAKLAASMTKDTSRAKLLEQQISQRLTIVDEELRVTDDSGQLTVSSLDELAVRIKESYPFLVDGSQATGGGATKSQASGERPREISRNEFDGLSQIERASFFKSGGKVVND